MSRTVTTWNPDWINAPEEQELLYRPFRKLIIPDEHEHHPNSIDTGECPECGAFICAICGSDQHSTGEGHDLSNPRYWGV